MTDDMPTENILWLKKRPRIEQKVSHVWRECLDFVIWCGCKLWTSKIYCQLYFIRDNLLFPSSAISSLPFPLPLWDTGSQTKSHKACLCVVTSYSSFRVLLMYFISVSKTLLRVFLVSIFLQFNCPGGCNGWIFWLCYSQLLRLSPHPVMLSPQKEPPHILVDWASFLSFLDLIIVD